jgi:hypothetical protein
MERGKFPRKYLVVGVLFILFGGTLLLRTLGFLQGVMPLWPILVTILGLYLLYRAYFLGGKESFVFYGIFCSLTGAFLLLFNADILGPLRVKNIWPFFMLFIGLALLFYSFRKKERYRIRYMIPALSIVFLSVVFLIFSLGWVGVSLRIFLVQFWPGILIFGGILLIVLDLLQKKKT